jgi:hypothetical protein
MHLLLSVLLSMLLSLLLRTAAAVPVLLQLADRLNRVAEGCERSQPLSVLLQVNTSGEETKHGCEPDEVCVCVGGGDGQGAGGAAS